MDNRVRIACDAASSSPDRLDSESLRLQSVSDRLGQVRGQTPHRPVGLGRCSGWPGSRSL
jgi:hypothetical protein